MLLSGPKTFDLVAVCDAGSIRAQERCASEVDAETEPSGSRARAAVSWSSFPPAGGAAPWPSLWRAAARPSRCHGPCGLGRHCCRRQSCSSRLSDGSVPLRFGRRREDNGPPCVLRETLQQLVRVRAVPAATVATATGSGPDSDGPRVHDCDRAQTRFSPTHPR